MQTDRPGSGSEEFSVRLSWPRADDAGAAPAPPPPAAAPPAPAAEEPEAVPEAAPEVPHEPQHAARSEAPSSPELPPRPAPGPLARPTSVTEVLGPAGDGNRMSRAFVEAFDRLSDRLLDRIRSLRQDVDADLASVRAELAALRQAVDEAGDRAPLRQLKTSLDELREDVVGLRRAVLEWPALEQVAEDVAAIRGDLAFLFDTSRDGAPAAPPTELLGELRRVVHDLGGEVERLTTEQPQVGALAPLLEEVATLRSELTAIRRRLPLRANALDDEQLERIVDAVAARVVDELRGEARRPKRR